MHTTGHNTILALIQMRWIDLAFESACETIAAKVQRFNFIIILPYVTKSSINSSGAQCFQSNFKI